ncbi:MAG: IMP dehydrogenase [Candidatus Pacearchaeota archaeon]|jgi:hypothetical protein|nr:IMP dehydrogenase [Clostridia bacterium]
MIERKFDFDDILIVPSVSTEISSRSECNLFNDDGMLPIMTAPMDTVINNDNYEYFLNNNIYAVFPRVQDARSQDYSDFAKIFKSYSLTQFTDLFLKDSTLSKLILGNDRTYYVLIDIANGHMASLSSAIGAAKRKYGTKLYLMVGNIANPETYWDLSIAGADAIRCGIGGGCFIRGTKVLTKTGLKNIEDVKVGDYVLTHTNIWQKVIETYTYNKEEDIIFINGEGSTMNHEYYVIDKKYKDIVDDDNISAYAKWISAVDLDENTHLLIQY